MFGYIITNQNALPAERQQRFRSFYCGLCHVLRRRHGLTGTATLSYDLTFLALLLNALYEPGEQDGSERCVAHPAKRHPFVVSPVMDYVADMNVALAYHKCRDNWIDDHSVIAAGEGALLRRAKISNSHRLEVDDVLLDADERSCMIKGEEINLTTREFNILYKLLSYPKKTFTRAQLMDEFWDADSSSTLRTVDVYMTKLREKFACTDSFEIQTVRGLGYKAVIKG